MSGALLITLFTDAGFCPDRKIGTWAAWAKCNGVTSMVSGALRGNVEGSDIAEMRALVNGVCAVLARIKPPRGSRIIAQTDCQSAINAMLGTGYKKKQAKHRVRHATDEMRKRLTAAGVQIKYRHVPGHLGMATPRNAVNTWCDRECTRLLRQARAELEKAA
jgi:ribonuclease HI